MRVIKIFLLAALVAGLAMAAYILLEERLRPRPSVVVDPANYRPDGTIAAVPLDNPDAALADPAAGKPLDGGEADAAKLCSADAATLGETLPAGGSVFGHLRSHEAPRSALVGTPSGFGGGNCQYIHGSAATALRNLLAAARTEAPEVGRAITGISCFRSIARQAGLFCNPDRIAARGYAGQARWVAPPGYSEHSTGLAIDFGNRNGGCNLEQCFKSDPVGRWLRENARRFGFQLSFPEGNGQGVSFEPWHYRYVGGGDGGAPRRPRLAPDESVAGPTVEEPPVLEIQPGDEIFTPPGQ